MSRFWTTTIEIAAEDETRVGNALDRAGFRVSPNAGMEPRQAGSAMLNVALDYDGTRQNLEVEASAREMFNACLQREGVEFTSRSEGTGMRKSKYRVALNGQLTDLTLMANSLDQADGMLGDAAKVMGVARDELEIWPNDPG